MRRHVSAAGSSPAPSPPSDVPRSFTTTRAPSAARHSAISRPIPPPAPVTMATRPSSNPIVCPFCDKVHLYDTANFYETWRLSTTASLHQGEAPATVGRSLLAQPTPASTSPAAANDRA